jgi:HD-GYP domain-containing protein (c-di-GMP phosphodiesterase class II)
MGSMKEIDIEGLKEGQVLRGHVLFDDNFIVLPKLLMLTASDLERVRKYNLYPLYTVDKTISSFDKGGLDAIVESEETAESEKSLQSTYDLLLPYLDTIFSACRQKKQLSLNTFQKAAALTVDYVLKNQEEALIRVARGMESMRLAAHSLNTGILSAVLATSVNMKGSELVEVVIGALFHDIGILFLDDAVQDRYIEQHTLLGFKYLKEIEGTVPSITMPSLQHHEKTDGSGYPAGLHLNDTAHSSRIVAICDSCDSHISYIRFGDDISLHLKKEDLLSWKREDFDIRLFSVFSSVLSRTYQVGRRVLLSDMTIGVIAKTSHRFPISPVVDIVSDSKGETPEESKTVELVKRRDLWIERFLEE